MKHVSVKTVTKILFVILVLCAAVGAAVARESLRGELEVVQIDFPRGESSMVQYFLRADGKGKPQPVFFAAGVSVKDLKSGRQVILHGRRGQNGFEVEAIDLAQDGAATSVGDSNLGAATVNERNAVVLMVDLLDAKASTRYTLDQVAGHMYENTQSVDGLFKASSWNQTGFRRDVDGDSLADVFGPFTVNSYAADSCDYYGWAAAADQAAADAGIDLSLYRHRVYVLPRYNDLPRCNWAGVGNLGCGSTCRAWVAEAESGMVYAHELGHNLSLHHAGTDPENDGVFNTEYGDHSGVMGSNRAWNQVNAPHRDQMGWFDAWPGSLVDGTGGGVFELYPLEADRATGAVGTQVLRIAKPDSGEFYYVSYRQQIGDYGIASSTYGDRISVHRYGGSGAIPTALIGVFGQDESFYDAANDITITVLSTGGATASVQVGTAGCVARAPALDVSPTGQSVMPGGTVSYSVLVANNDGGGCGASSFSVSQSLPAGFSGTWNASRVTLQPGETAALSWVVQAPVDVVDGDYPLVVTLSDEVYVAEHMDQDAQVVVRLDGTAPDVPTGLSFTAKTKGRAQVNLQWQAAADAGSGISHYLVLRDGVRIGATSATGFTDNQVTSGATYVYAVAAVDQVGNVSGSSEGVTVTLPSKGGKGKDGGNGNGKGRNK